jgi:predicted amidohydrolase
MSIFIVTTRKTTENVIGKMKNTKKKKKSVNSASAKQEVVVLPELATNSKT